MATPASFATPDDLAKAWRPLTAAEGERAAPLLAKASRRIRLTCPNWRKAETADPGVCADVACDMVKRAMTAETTNPAGWSQTSSTTGPFSDSHTFANPNADLYLTSAEILLLGGRRGAKAFAVSMNGGG